MQIWRTAQIIASTPSPSSTWYHVKCRKKMWNPLRISVLRNVKLSKKHWDGKTTCEIRTFVHLSSFLFWKVSNKLNARRYKFSTLALIKIYFNFIVLPNKMKAFSPILFFLLFHLVHQLHLLVCDHRESLFLVVFETFGSLYTFLFRLIGFYHLPVNVSTIEYIMIYLISSGK